MGPSLHNPPSPQPDNSPLPAEFLSAVERLEQQVAGVAGGGRSIASVRELLERDLAVLDTPFSRITPLVNFAEYETHPVYSRMTLNQIMEATRVEREKAWENEKAERRGVIRALIAETEAASPEVAVEILNTWEQHIHRLWLSRRCDEALESAKAALLPGNFLPLQKTADELRSSFREEVPAFAKVSEAALERALTMYSEVQASSQKFAAQNELDFRASLKLAAETFRKRLPSDPEKSDLYALLRETWARTNGQSINSTQMLAVILLGLQDEAARNAGALGYYQEIGTGEGKSLICAVHAAFSGLQGKQVVIATFNEELARRDAKGNSTFFSHLRLSSGHFGIQEQKSAGNLDADILYSTSQDLIFRYLHDRLEARAPLYGRKWDLLIVDEADALLFDLRRESCRISSPSTEEIPDEFWKSWIEFADRIIDDPERGANQILINPRGAFGAFKAAYQDQYPILMNFDPIEGAAFMRSAVTSRLFKNGRDFVVRKVKAPDSDDGDPRMVNGIVIVDFKHTGRIREFSRWNHGLHQFIAVRHGVPAWGMQGTLGQMAHADFAKLFGSIGCVSGSWGGEVERAALSERLKVTGFSVPRDRVSKRSDDLNPLLVRSEEALISAISAKIDSVQTDPILRPILLVCESIEQSQKVHAELSKCFRCQLLNDEDNLDADGEEQSESELLAAAGNCGMITVTHKMSGRGSDIRLSDEARADGGLLVIQAYLPVDARDQVQVWGRAARQGDPGGACIIACLTTDTFFNSLPSNVRQLIIAETDRDPAPHRDLSILIDAARIGQSSYEQAKAGTYEAGDRLLGSIQEEFFGLQKRRRDEAPDAVRELLALQEDMNSSIGISMRSGHLEAWWVERFRVFDCRVRNAEYLPRLDNPQPADITSMAAQLGRRLGDMAGTDPVTTEWKQGQTSLQTQLRIIFTAFCQRLLLATEERLAFDCCGLDEELATFKTDLLAAHERFPFKA